MSSICAVIFNLSLCKCCFGWTSYSSSFILSSGLFENTELTTFLSEEASAGGNVPRPWKQILCSSHQGLSALTSGLWCVAFFSTAAWWNMVIALIRRKTHQSPLLGDCNQCVPEGWGRTAEIWVAAFLPCVPPERKKEPFSTGSLFERDSTGCILQHAYGNVGKHAFNVNIDLHLWLWGYWGVRERESNAGGFRSEEVILSLLCRRRRDFLAHVLVDNVTSSWKMRPTLCQRAICFYILGAITLWGHQEFLHAGVSRCKSLITTKGVPYDIIHGNTKVIFNTIKKIHNIVIMSILWHVGVITACQ